MRTVAPQQFKAHYFMRLLRKDWNPFTPDSLVISDQTIKHSRRNWYLLSNKMQVYHFQNIIGIDVNKALFGADIIIETSGAGQITVGGFLKRDADQIVSYCSRFIMQNSQRGTTEALAGAIAQAVGASRNAGVSIADELLKLKSLADSGVLSMAEFEDQKRKMLNR